MRDAPAGATLLLNGMVLVEGGEDGFGDRLASAELYDPVTGIWSTTGSLTDKRSFHTATLLQNGMVLAEGGFSPNGALASAELYDPAAGTWSITGSLKTGRFRETAILLPNGNVLVAGGIFLPASRARNSTIQPPAPGTPPAASTKREVQLRQLFCPTARCL